MDEFSRGMEPEVKRYFKRIMNSFFIASFWLLAVSTAGLFFQLAYIHDGIKWYNIVFYLLALLSFAWLILYLYRTWSKSIK